MANTYFKFKTFTIEQQNCAMKVTTDACLFGAWIAAQISNDKYILDIGGGTGLLSLMLAHKNPLSNITSIEIETRCFQQLSENIFNSTFSNQINPVHGNILAFDAKQKFNVIVSNPPFFEHQLKSDKEEINQARHDTSLSLNTLFLAVADILEDDGEFYILFPFYRKEELLKLIFEMGMHVVRLTTVKQTPAHEPFRIMARIARKPHPLQEDEMMITDNNGNYTAAFIELLKDYYLNL